MVPFDSGTIRKAYSEEQTIEEMRSLGCAVLSHYLTPPDLEDTDFIFYLSIKNITYVSNHSELYIPKWLEEEKKETTHLIKY